MFNKNNTKRALLGSALALILCISMLVGTTFAWFTDSVTSAGNKIQAGNLDVDLYMWTATDANLEITNESAPIFDIADKAQKGTKTLWEPGKTEVVYFSIKNNGSLDLKYKVALNVLDADGEQNLYEAMQYDIIENATYGTVTAWDGTNAVGVEPGINATQANDVALAADGEHFFALAIHMKEEAGNKYQGGQVDFDLKVLAAQLMSESDSFDNTYDEFAGYDGVGFAKVENGLPTVAYAVGEDGAKLGYVNLDPSALEDPTKPSEVSMLESSYKPNFTVVAGSEVKTVDINVSNLNGNVEVPVNYFVGEMLDPATVSVYHYNDKMESRYNPTTGYVTFYSKDFSPFTFVYDADSVYVAPEAKPEDLPEAVVTRTPENENVKIEWANWDVQPDYSVDPEPKLEGAFQFKSSQTADEAYESPYANWYCDFYVKLDRDLHENQIFLGGNYGSFGWVGFHNGDVTLNANEEIPLLGSVTQNPWTYADVMNFVSVFTCGVGDVNDALKGATFTVMLRLTNPEDESEFYNVATINHTFQ